MADEMIYSIEFDLESAVKKASEDWESKYADKLEKAIQKRAININLKVSKLNFESLEEVKKRLAELKIEPITPETKAAIKELAGELRELAKALEAVKKYSERAGGTPEAVRNSKIEVNEQRAAAARELAHQRAAKAAEAELKLASARERAAKAADKAAGSVKNLSRAYESQSSLIERLIKKMVALYSINEVRNFITSIREVTAQFELQRVSLGAIIQDQQKANELFAEIKNFAIKSPLSIMDLTKYTKQVAAYGIETNKLFDTTKMLADISVGLGVGLERLSLFYGQVFATGYLRASEVRQATEAGIPLVAKLAEKLSQAKGELVSAADVMDMISKRAISFEMVEDVFKDMTSAGGMFYNMQEQQGNTLFGLWAKLGDAASLMYDEIGNTESINNGMKSSIELLTLLMKNWRLVGGEIGIITAAIAISTIRNKSHAKSVELQESALNKVRSAGRRYNAILKEEATLSNIATASQKQSIAARKANAKAALDAAIAEKTAAAATNLWARSMDKLKAAFMGNWVTLVLSLIAAIGVAIYNAVQKANKLKNELASISAETSVLQTQGVRNFEHLANSAVQAADGSKKQKDALDELNRTYGQMLPAESLKIENLKAMRGNYDTLTNSIREYISMEQKRKAIEAVQTEYGDDINKANKKIASALKSYGASATETGRFIAHFTENAEKDFGSMEERIKYSLDACGIALAEWKVKHLSSDFKEDIWNKLSLGFYSTTLGFEDLIENTNKLNEETKRLDSQYSASVGNIGKYTADLENLQSSWGKLLFATDGTYSTSQKNLNTQIVTMFNDLNNAIIREMGASADIFKKGWIDIIAVLDENNLDKITTAQMQNIVDSIDPNKYPDLRKFAEAIQNIYKNMVPQESHVQLAQTKMKMIVRNAGGDMDTMQQYLMKSGEDWKTYVTRIKSEMDSEIQKLKELRAERAKTAAWGLLGKMTNPFQDIKIEQQEKLVEQLTSIWNAFKPFYSKDNWDKKNKGTKSDPRLQTLKEEISLVQKLYQEYKQLEKQEGASKAASDMERMAKASIDALSKKYGISLPTTAKDLTSALEILYKKMAALPKKVFPALDKELNELRWTIEKVNIDDSQKAIEKQLKELADRISRTKTAREFYDKILSQTGDVELAANVTLSLYGDTGEGLFDATVKQIEAIFKSNDPNVKIDLSSVIDTANQRINYGALAKVYEKYQNVINDSDRKTAEDIIKNGQKIAEKNIESWEKELAKAKDYEEQRTEIIRRESQRRAEIIKSSEYTPEEKQERLNLSRDKEAKDISDINLKEFKGSDFYIQMFEDLGNKATNSLKLLRSEIQRIIDTDKNLSPENMKAMVDALEKIDDEIEDRNPMALMKDGLLGMFDAAKKLKVAREELKKAEADYAAQKPMLDAEVADAKSENDADKEDVAEKETALLAIRQQIALLKEQEVVDETQLALLLEQEVAADNALVSSMLKQEESALRLTNATAKRTKEENKVKKKKKEQSDAENDAVDSQNKFIKGVQKAKEITEKVKTVLEGLEPIFGDLTSDATTLGDVFNAMVNAMSTFTSIMELVIVLQETFNIVSESNPWMAIAAAVLAVTAALAGFIGAQKVKKANKEIERQQELLDQLEYAYGRLEKSIEKAFGGDYVSLFKQKQQNLYASAMAYQKQLEAERSKGKKADEDKIKEYEDAYRDAMDEITDMQGELAAQMLGTDLTSAARDFAKAWLDAYKEFGNTADAMSDKFHEMIESMVVEGALGKVMERALTPMFNMIDNMSEEDFYSQDFWKNVVEKAEQGAKDADYGAQTMMKFLEQAGISMRDLGGDMTGISRDIASASEESINGLAAGINTQNFYISQIHANVAAIAAQMDATSSAANYAVDYTPLIQQSLENQAMLVRNTAEAVVECRRSAVAAESTLAAISKVIIPKSSSSAYVVSVKI